MKRKMLQKLVPGLCASLVLVSATSLTGCSTDTKTAATASDADKSETVYVKADASGTINEIKVQTDLKNNGTSKEIKDFSTLKDIKIRKEMSPSPSPLTERSPGKTKGRTFIMKVLLQKNFL